ncbi:MAG: type I phosphomannose isomerase catalytic subunit [Vicinamibacterales bacterium]
MTRVKGVLYPLTFRPIQKPRVWGGELWTVSDRPGDESVVANGALAGTTLRQLMTRHREALLGTAAAAAGDRFPILCKIIDARATLSVQVHPPAERAAMLGGEPKTEMWYVAAADPGAELYVGLKRGVSREEFEQRLAAGTVAECLQRLPVARGDVMFLPSGRVHAIGSGLRLFEIQQNSDTTYRVFDWNRPGLDGKPRELHIVESLASIDFGDIEPALVPHLPAHEAGLARRPLVRHALFDIDACYADVDDVLNFEAPRLRVVACVEKRIRVSGGGEEVELEPEGFCVIPASVTDARIPAAAGSSFLVTTAGRS